MQAKQLSDHELVKICMAALCEKAGFPDPSALVQRDLQTLTDAIETHTGVLISLSTIKRLLNGQFSRLPQIATLNALAQYLDYPNWQAFRIAFLPSDRLRPSPSDRWRPSDLGARPTSARPTSAASASVPAPPSVPAPKSARPRILAAAALLLTTLALLAVELVHHPTLANLDKAQFSATKVTGNDLPNSVIFHYNIDDVIGDSFFIQQSWDRSRRVRIYKKNYTLTDIYYEPGYHTAKLFANDTIIRTVDVSIPTDRWVFYVKEEPFKGRVVYLTPTNTNKDSSLQLTINDLEAANIDIPKYNAFIQVFFPSHIQYSSDDFTLHCRVRVKNINNANCPFLMTEIYCQRNFMYFQNRLKGCTSETIAQFGDNFLNGKTHDLSGLGTDITAWKQLTLTVKDHRATITIDGAPAYSATYRSSSGMITGLGFIANGLCSVDSVDLRSGDGQPIITYHPPSAR